MKDEKEHLHEGLQSTDIFAAADRAKVKSTQLLEEQGLTAISLALSKVLSDLVNDPEAVLEKLK